MTMFSVYAIVVSRLKGTYDRNSKDKIWSRRILIGWPKGQSEMEKMLGLSRLKAKRRVAITCGASYDYSDTSSCISRLYMPMLIVLMLIGQLLRINLKRGKVSMWCNLPTYTDLEPRSRVFLRTSNDPLGTTADLSDQVVQNDFRACTVHRGIGLV
ncbi:hypothetical protein K402DRAFT_195173 [Aulographum hederae CBS 113979]|uniref:Uncharacterized protein n=1 Tax=Aulographum hederae CBS 113979 TaxID=1176131 RepID=A0A6G1GNQ2_9PEZI|nr:hypothetical protein K402DRAFT_195173 [Aulographum hederae CBS 113979]